MPDIYGRLLGLVAIGVALYLFNEGLWDGAFLALFALFGIPLLIVGVIAVSYPEKSPTPQEVLPDRYASPPRLRPPTGLYLAVLLWVAVAVYGAYVSAFMPGPQLHAPFSPLDGPLVTQVQILRALLALLSFIQFLSAYGLLRGSSWSLPVGLALPIVLLGVYLGFYATCFSAPTRLGLMTPMVYYNLLVAVGFATVLWAYFTRPSVRRYLLRWT